MNTKTKELTLIGLMAAITCIAGPLSLPLPFSPVPVSLTNLAIYFSVYILGMKRGTISYLVYLLLGLVGLPVFSAFTSGETLWTDRRVSDRFYLYGAHLRVLCGAVERAVCGELSWHGSRNSSVLSLWHSMACVSDDTECRTAVPQLDTGTSSRICCRRAALYHRRSFENGAHAGCWRSSASACDKGSAQLAVLN